MPGGVAQPGPAPKPLHLWSDPQCVRDAIRSSSLRYYVYLLHKPDGTPFYVGKGIDLRVLQHAAEARTTTRRTHKLNLIRSLVRVGAAVHYSLDSFHELEAGAHARERELIQAIGRHGLGTGPLTNQTDGGEGASNPSEESKERHRQSLAGLDAEDPDRRIANRFLHSIIQDKSLGSATLKSLKDFKPEPLRPNRKRFPMTKRQAATLAASAVANQIMLGPGCRLPRRLSIDDRAYIIENGVGKDMLVSGMVTLADATAGQEVLEVTPAGYEYIVSILDKKVLVDFGVLDPEV